jgi:hypothetical protein
LSYLNQFRLFYPFYLYLIIVYTYFNNSFSLSQSLCQYRGCKMAVLLKWRKILCQDILNLLPLLNKSCYFHQSYSEAILSCIFMFLRKHKGCRLSGLELFSSIPITILKNVFNWSFLLFVQFNILI